MPVTTRTPMKLTNIPSQALLGINPPLNLRKSAAKIGWSAAIAVPAATLVILIAKKKPMKKGEGYCLKCKNYRKMINVKEVEIKNKRTKNTRKAMKGECKKCGTTMMKFI